jgi:uncharacterized protein YbjT (DUF2867 family)
MTISESHAILNNPQVTKILVTGATGYIGGRLVPRLLAAGYPVRLLVRDTLRLQGRPWLDQVEIVQGDVLKPETLPAALAGAEVAYYLVHSMSGSADFHERDLIAARNFGTAARAAGVQRIVYLGGLGDPQTELSKHLRSRQQTGAALGEAGVPVTEFRAAVIVGSGSLSFEMVRYLTERVPVMVCPSWVFTRVQPIGIEDVLRYLLASLETPQSAGQVIEIGGADVLTYGDMMLGYAQERGLRRYLLPVPVLTPRLSSYWVHLVTPIPASIARPLIDGLRNEVIVRTEIARKLFPDIQTIDYQTAVRHALDTMETGKVETIWSDALASSQGDLPPVYFTHQQGLIIERRQRSISASPEVVFSVFSGLGGARGWLAYNFAWQLRGLIDRLVGGVGMRRGRRHPDELRVGDAVDFWRVEAIEPGRMLRLRAEMKVPGKAWLQFEANPAPGGQTLLVQTAFFEPRGLSGLLYWYILYPIHGLIFGSMVKNIGKRAEGLVPSALQADAAQIK